MKLWALHVATLFVVLLMPGSCGDEYANSFSVIRYHDAAGFITSLERAVLSSTVLGFFLGFIGAMAARSALRVNRGADRAALALGLNVAVAGMIPLVLILLF